jgi:hypothetical protein
MTVLADLHLRRRPGRRAWIDCANAANAGDARRIGPAFTELSGSVPPRGGARLAALARALNGAREEAGSVMTLESRMRLGSRYGCGLWQNA